MNIVSVFGTYLGLTKLEKLLPHGAKTKSEGTKIELKICIHIIHIDM